jgi:serine/threonine protein kinase
MSTKIGHFEIVSELAKSPTGIVYKANDLESGQTVALKAIQLSAFGEHAQALEQALSAEAEATKVLSSPNITNVYGAGEIDGQFCAAMEYVQGNSIATMLARKEGFSIWDLLDIGRQLCGGLDYAASQNQFHHSLEPSKIMCGWDGTVKILSFGISSVGDFVQHPTEGLSSILHYMSPEQIRGEALDERSNLFSLGAMFYEMVTERKAFDRDDVESLRQSILESTPVAPVHVSPKIHPVLSDLIMKALAKDPAERFQSGRELLDELEKCKESKPAAAKKAPAPSGLTAPTQAKAAAQSKFVGQTTPKPTATPQRPATPAKPAAQPVAKSAAVKPAEKKTATPAAKAVEKKAVTQAVSKNSVSKAAAAAAGAGSGEVSVSPNLEELDLTSASDNLPSQPTIEAEEYASPSMSSAVLDEPAVETFEPQEEDGAPRIAVDPMMAEGGPSGSSGTSFSEISELPPLKEAYVAPPSRPAPIEEMPGEPPATTAFRAGSAPVEEKPKIQPREVAQKAMKEIKGVPPKLMLYSLAGAAALILIIGIGMTLYIHSLGDDDSGSSRPAATTPKPAAQEPSRPAPAASAPVPVEAAPAVTTPTEDPEPVATSSKSTSSPKGRNAKKKAAPVAPAIVPGQLSVDSAPQGAQVQVDGQTDASWVTPFAMTDLQPGQHSITVSKPGYVTDTRSINVTSGNRATEMVHLTQLLATLVVKSDPPGASVYIDGKDAGAKTPAQVSVNKGQHVVLVRLSGYIDETMNAQFALGQTFNFSPTLRALGNVDSIKTVGKMSKLFGGGKGEPGQATLSIRTQPKGAQVSVNQHMLDKGSPVDVLLDPGNYVVDITMTGYAPIHKVITAEKKGKVVIDEVLQTQ